MSESTPGSLAEWLRARAPVEPHAAIRLALAMADELIIAHERGEHHGALKPETILVEEARSGEIKVRFEMTSIAPGRLASFDGRPRRTDEQSARHGNECLQSDFEALGAIVHEALTGQPPSMQAREGAGSAGATPNNPRRLLQLAPWLDGELVTLVEGLLARSQESSYPNTETLVGALRALLATTAPSSSSQASRVDSNAAESACTVPAPDVQSNESTSHPGILHALVGQTIGGRYTLTRVIGEGGMGAVFEARSDRGEDVAIKVVRPEAVSPSVIRT